MDVSDETCGMQRAFKRRRFQPDTTMESSETVGDYPPFMNMAISKNIFAGSGKLHCMSCAVCQQSLVNFLVAAVVEKHDTFGSLCYEG